MIEECRKSILDGVILVRTIRGRDIHKETGKIKKGAFIPRRNGKDDDGLSVSQPLSDSSIRLAGRMQSQEGRYCTLKAGDIRAISVGDVTLEVCPDPTERDPFHALIKNVPTSLGHTTIATRFAQLLAQASIEYSPPPEDSHG